MESLAKVFGSLMRLKTLRLFIFNTDTTFSLADIASRTKLSKQMVRRDLADLVASGLIRKKGQRATLRYQTNPHFEHLDALAVFIRETTVIQPKRIIAALKHTGVLRLVALSGLFTGAIEPKIDLLIVGDRLDERAIAMGIHTLEADLGREIRYAAFATGNFRYRLSVYDRLIRDVLDYPHRILVDKIGL